MSGEDTPAGDVNNTSNKFSRRNVLKSSGMAFAGTSILNKNFEFKFTQSHESKSVKLNDVHFLEGVILYKDVPEGYQYHNDDLIRYAIDSSKKKLLFNKKGRNKNIRALKNHSSVIHTRHGVHPASGTVLGGQATQSIASELGYRTTVSEGLMLAKDHLPPEISISTQRDLSAQITAEGDQYEVDPETTKQFELSPTTVTIRQRSEDLKEVDDPKSPGETILVRELGALEDITVTPTLMIKNSGRLETYHEK